jgi:cystathionine beta-lyase/cystathionine gamma-synthase
MIHARLTPEQRAEAGISENLIRVSIGLEAPGDIMADFDQALGG